MEKVTLSDEAIALLLGLLEFNMDSLSGILQHSSAPRLLDLPAAFRANPI
jgi:hypothetical protein